MFDLTTTEGRREAMLLASNPSTPTATLESMVVEMFDPYLFQRDQSNNRPMLRQELDEIGKRLAQNPAATPAMLVKLVEFFPVQVAANMALSLLVVENPNLVRDLVEAIGKGQDQEQTAFLWLANIRALNPIVTYYVSNSNLPWKAQLAVFANGLVAEHSEDPQYEDDTLYDSLHDVHEAMEDRMVELEGWDDFTYEDFLACFDSTDLDPSTVGAIEIPDLMTEMGLHEAKQLAENPQTPTAILEALGEALLVIEYVPNDRRWALADAVAIALATNPAASPKLLCALMVVVPLAVAQNVALPLLHIENPNLVQDLIEGFSMWAEGSTISQFLLSPLILAINPIVARYAVDPTSPLPWKKMELIELQDGGALKNDDGFFTRYRSLEVLWWALRDTLIEYNREYDWLDHGVDTLKTYFIRTEDTVGSVPLPNILTPIGRQQGLRLAQDPETPLDVLEGLVRQILAPILQDQMRRHNQEQFDELIRDMESIGKALAQNPAASPALLSRLVGLYPKEVGENLALPILHLENPRILDEILDRASIDPDDVEKFVLGSQVQAINPPVAEWKLFRETALPWKTLTITQFQNGWALMDGSWTSFFRSMTRAWNYMINELVEHNEEQWEGITAEDIRSCFDYRLLQTKRDTVGALPEFTLLTDSGFAEAKALASDPQTPTETLEALCLFVVGSHDRWERERDRCQEVSNLLAQNPSATPTMLVYLMEVAPLLVAENLALPMLLVEDPLLLDKLVEGFHWASDNERWDFYHTPQMQRLNPEVAAYAPRKDSTIPWEDFTLHEFRNGHVFQHDDSGYVLYTSFQTLVEDMLTSLGESDSYWQDVTPKELLTYFHKKDVSQPVVGRVSSGTNETQEGHRVGGAFEKEILNNPMAAPEDLHQLAAFPAYHIRVLQHPNLAPEDWWELVRFYPLEAMTSAAYGLMTLESPERWEAIQRKDVNNWVERYSTKLTESQQRLFCCDSVHHVLPLWQAEFPGDQVLADTLAEARQFAQVWRWGDGAPWRKAKRSLNTASKRAHKKHADLLDGTFDKIAWAVHCCAEYPWTHMSLVGALSHAVQAAELLNQAPSASEARYQERVYQWNCLLSSLYPGRNEEVGANPIDEATDAILEAIARAKGNLTRASARLELTEAELNDVMFRYGIRMRPDGKEAYSSRREDLTKSRRRADISKEEVEQALYETEGSPIKAAKLLRIFPDGLYDLMKKHQVDNAAFHREITEESIRDALEKMDGSREHTADFLGIGLSTLRRLCRRYDIDPPDKKSDVTPEELSAALEQTHWRRDHTAELLGVSLQTVSNLMERYGMDTIREGRKEMMKSEVQEAMARTHGNRGQAAELLGISYQGLTHLLTRYGMLVVKKQRDISEEELRAALEQTRAQRQETAELLGVSPPTVSNLMERYGMGTIKQWQARFG